MIGHIKSGQYLKKYCPPHKARGIHDFILATKSSVWIIIIYINFSHGRPIKNIYVHLPACLLYEIVLTDALFRQLGVLTFSIVV